MSKIISVEPPTSICSPRQLIEWIAALFDKHDLAYGHGTDNSYDEAVYLVLRSANLDFDVAESILDQPLKREQIDRINNLVKQRINDRKPVAYLLNEAWFAGLPFYVNENVLIPRSPIAELIMDACTPWSDPNRVKNILDIGTGSGCIAVACALAFPEAIVDAIDISKQALEVAEKNIKHYELQDQVHLVFSDLFKELSGRHYDLIIANPPYVDAEDMSSLPPEFLHEPRIGLASGHDGLDATRKILHQSSEYLNPGGIMIVEVGNSQHALIEQFPDIPFTWLEFEFGGEGVFMLTYDDLCKINTK